MRCRCSQLPSVSADIWITKFQSWVLNFHVIIFVGASGHIAANLFCRRFSVII